MPFFSIRKLFANTYPVFVCLGHAAPVRGLLVTAAHDHIPVHRVELVKVAHGHQGSKIVVPSPEVRVVEDLIQDRVRSLAQSQGSLLPDPVLALNPFQGLQRIKSPDLVLGLPSKEGPQLLTTEVKKVMERMRALPVTTSRISMMELNTMQMIKLALLVLLWLWCSNQFLLSILFQGLLLFWRRGVNFCCRA